MNKFVCINCFDFVEECGHTHLENMYPIAEVKIEDARTETYFVCVSKARLLEIGVEEITEQNVQKYEKTV